MERQGLSLRLWFQGPGCKERQVLSEIAQGGHSQGSRMRAERGEPTFRARGGLSPDLWLCFMFQGARDLLSKGTTGPGVK